jgi:hypothetical protein
MKRHLGAAIMAPRQSNRRQRQQEVQHQSEREPPTRRKRKRRMTTGGSVAVASVAGVAVHNDIKEGPAFVFDTIQRISTIIQRNFSSRRGRCCECDSKWKQPSRVSTGPFESLMLLWLYIAARSRFTSISAFQLESIKSSSPMLASPRIGLISGDLARASSHRRLELWAEREDLAGTRDNFTNFVTTPSSKMFPGPLYSYRGLSDTFLRSKSANNSGSSDGEQWANTTTTMTSNGGFYRTTVVSQKQLLRKGKSNVLRKPSISTQLNATYAQSSGSGMSQT